ncbi:MAG: NAD(P)-binding protein [Candidatus Micrarchaeaceae archaeon]
MPLLRDRNLVIVIIALLLFAASLMLTLISGMAFALALIWNLLNVLGIAYSVLHLSSVNNAYLVSADFIDSIVFVLLAFFLASWFYSLVKRVDIESRLTISRIRRMSGHIIVAPYNSFSDFLIKELAGAGLDFIVISDSKKEVDKLRESGITALLGSVSSADVMRIAGAERASYIIACSNDDTLNTLIAVTAKSVSKKVRIIARAKNIEDLPKISKAGAYRVIFPEASAGRIMGDEILKRAIFQ